MTAALPAFDAFFEALHGRPPFPWQRRLAARVLETGEWPHLLDLPTASGKTAAIDIALYAMACRPDVLPRRIVLVVDRRVIVDQGVQRARRIQRALSDAADGPLVAIADRLRATFGGERGDPPFSVSVLRGGMPRDEAWALRPDMPTVVVSTVDQVGSRLLFRGYGVSESMAPVHAGLLGNDCLYLLDEVQLSTAFAETLGAITARWRTWHTRNGGQALPDRWQVVAMSATPNGVRPDAGRMLTLDDEDRSDPRLARRLACSKPARLREVRVTGDDAARSDGFVRACVDTVEQYVASAQAEVSAVVVNRVATAREAHRALLETLGERADVVLLTGRMRPLDRERILGRASDPTSLVSKLSVGRQRGGLDRPIVVVATQSIEAGADFDFDALVTECASLDALRQRFGRLDRVGELGSAPATILARHDQIGERSDDPVYGQALAATWRWLESVATAGTIDFGNAAFPAPAADVARTLSTSSVSAPVLLPGHIDTWAQTNPRPEPDPEVALWLHGPARGIPEVRVVWRADVSAADLQTIASVDLVGASNAAEIQAAWLARLTAVPPSSLEALSVPLHAARAWLTGAGVARVADVEGGSADTADQEDEPGGRLNRPCLLVSTRGVAVIEPGGLRPGCTVVVPSSYGGISHGNWEPLAASVVSDLGDLAQLVHRGKLVLRLDSKVWSSQGDQTLDAHWMAAAAAAGIPEGSDEEASAPFRLEIGEWLDTHVRADGPIGLAIREAVLPSGPSRPRMRVVDVGRGDIAIVGTRRIDPRRYLDIGEEPVGDTVSDQDESSSFTGQDVTLEEHLADVAALSERFARNLGMPYPIVAAVTRAARWHDIGKGDPRFQQMLTGGSSIRLALRQALLAKSAGESRDRAAHEQARLRSGYPPGYRHELLSLAMLEGLDAAVVDGADEALVTHLVASHHGWCRPFAPAIEPGAPVDVEIEVAGTKMRANTAHGYARIDSGVAERYMALTECYGWWGLAWLEAILRLADHRASEGT